MKSSNLALSLAVLTQEPPLVKDAKRIFCPTSPPTPPPQSSRAAYCVVRLFHLHMGLLRSGLSFSYVKRNCRGRENAEGTIHHLPKCLPATHTL